MIKTITVTELLRGFGKVEKYLEKGFSIEVQKNGVIIMIINQPLQKNKKRIPPTISTQIKIDANQLTSKFIQENWM